MIWEPVHISKLADVISKLLQTELKVITWLKPTGFLGSNELGYVTDNLVNVIPVVIDASSVLYPGDISYLAPWLSLFMYTNGRAERCALSGLGFCKGIWKGMSHTAKYKLMQMGI